MFQVDEARQHVIEHGVIGMPCNHACKDCIQRVMHVITVCCMNITLHYGTKLHFKSPTAEWRHVVCVGVGGDVALHLFTCYLIYCIPVTCITCSLYRCHGNASEIAHYMHVIWHAMHATKTFIWMKYTMQYTYNLFNIMIHYMPEQQGVYIPFSIHSRCFKIVTVFRLSQS
jgi:hypothetical protein